MVSTIIFAFWYAGAGVKALAAYRIFRKGLLEDFAPVWLFIAISVVRSSLLWYLHLAKYPAYKTFYAYSMPFMLLLETFAIVGVFWTLTENYRNFRKPGTCLLVALALLGAGAAWITRFMAVPDGWADVWQIATILQRYVTLVMITMLLGTRLLLPRVHEIPIRQTARRAADIMTYEAAFGLVTAVFTMALAGHSKPYDSLISVIGGFINGLLWAFWMPAASNECAGLPKPPAEEDLELAYQACIGRQDAIFNGIRDLRQELQEIR